MIVFICFVGVVFVKLGILFMILVIWGVLVKDLVLF